MSDTSYPTMTPQHFSTDPMLTSTIESRQLATMGEYIVIQYNSTTVHNTQYIPTMVGLLACIVSIGIFLGCKKNLIQEIIWFPKTFTCDLAKKSVRNFSVFLA